MATITRGKILRSDLANWDGKNATASRVDATGGTVTGLAVGNDVDVLQVYGSGTNRTRATIVDAINAIGSSYATLVFAPGTWTIDDDLTIPANVTCRVPAGCAFSVSSGKTLTLSGVAFVESPASWAGGDGTADAPNSIPRVQTPAEKEAEVTITDYSYPPGDIRRYGAAVDGATDDTDAWQAATDQCAEGGAPVYHEHGVSMAALINYLPGVTYIMGAGAVVKCLPDRANFQGRIFTTAQGRDAYESDVDSAPVVWIGGILDGNKDNQGTYTDGTKEHNCGILLGADAGEGGRLVARIHGVRFQNFTGDGLQIHNQTDATVSDIECYKCWRSGVSVTGAAVKLRGDNWRLYGDSTDRSDFDIEVDGYEDTFDEVEQVDIELSNIDIEHGRFEVSPASTTEFSSGSRIVLSNINHRGDGCTIAGRGSIVRISDSILTFTAMDGSRNRIMWPRDMMFDNVEFVFTGGDGASTFGCDIWPNSGSTTDTKEWLMFHQCKWIADSTIEAGDTVYGINLRTSAAAADNRVIVDGGYFDSTLDEAIHLTQGGKVIVQNAPQIECALFLFLTFAGTNYYDVQVFGSPRLGSGVTTYCRMNQGDSNNVLTHFGTVVDEVHNTFDTTAGGNPQNNVHRGYRTILVTSAPDASTVGNVGDRAVVKAPAAGSAVEYICTTRGWGSAAVWKQLTEAAS